MSCNYAKCITCDRWAILKRFMFEPSEALFGEVVESWLKMFIGKAKSDVYGLIEDKMCFGRFREWLESGDAEVLPIPSWQYRRGCFETLTRAIAAGLLAAGMTTDIQFPEEELVIGLSEEDAAELLEAGKGKVLEVHSLEELKELVPSEVFDKILESMRKRREQQEKDIKN